MRTTVVLFVIGAFVSMVGGVAVHAGPVGRRDVIDLDGTWQVAEGTMDAVPQQFGHTVPVPGLIDMAEPAFAEVGKKSEMREAFWYRRTFSVEGTIPDVAILKINKAKYGTKVWLNGELVGEHLPCFTPALLDVKEHLKGNGRQNELIVRVGADRECLPAGQPGGWDFEKYLYIPGIYDSVALILTGEPFIKNIQTVPDIEAQTVRVIVELASSRALTCRVTCSVSPAGARASVAGVEQADVPVAAGHVTRLDLTIPLPSCRLWSPEDPYLYELEIKTPGDSATARFGMRSFRFDRETGRAVLNGKPYFMRGTNVCAYRFFEDAERGDKPWREEWVRRLHQQFKSMHWNSIRYCIGFPPEIWYDIADEEGFLIQDEFPIWLLGGTPNEDPKAEKIVPEYTEWMRQRWNHPCVVIWDAQNESNTLESGKALRAVRHLDLSDRPWENGWAEPQSEKDGVEAHPYLFQKLWHENRGDDAGFRLADLAATSPVPALGAGQKKLGVPIIINEYAWLWLNRDGTTTCLTGNVYKTLLGPNSTTEQRRLLYAKYLAALTEFWRSGRKCAGVLHFCALAYSRAGDIPRPEGGATSDHFTDLEKLTFEPNFERYVRDAFAPVGLMIDYWGQDVPAGKSHAFSVTVINDLYEDYNGAVRLHLLKGDAAIAIQHVPCKVPALGRATLSFELPVPARAGAYTLRAELAGSVLPPTRSVRDVQVVQTK